MPRHVREVWTADCDRCWVTFDSCWFNGQFEADSFQCLMDALIKADWFMNDDGTVVLCWECKGVDDGVRERDRVPGSMLRPV